MPSSLTNLSRNKGRIERNFDDGTSLFIDYRPFAVTPRQMHRFQDLREREWEDLSIAEQRELADDTTKMLADTLIAWDLLDKDGQPIPPTYEGLQDVDYDTQEAILDLITEEQRLSKRRGTGQSRGSSTDISESPRMNGEASPLSRSSTSTIPSLNG